MRIRQFPIRFLYGGTGGGSIQIQIKFRFITKEKNVFGNRKSMRKTCIIICLAALITLTFAGCRRSAGLYSPEEMQQVHDLTLPVMKQVTAYHNVIEQSLPGTLSGRIAGDPNYIEELALMRIDPSKPMIALTFDDGPRVESTTRILDTLQRYGAKATFFVIGTCVTDQTKDLLKRMSNMGCEVGSHTYDHTDLTIYDAESMKADLDKTKAIIESASGKPCTLMRPPGGAFNEDVSASIEYPMILWYIDTRDWESRDAASVTSITEQYACDGAIVLMHDIYNSSADAAEQIIPWLDAQGYQMVTISQLAAMRGIKLEAGKSYYDFLPKTSSAATASSDGSSDASQSQDNSMDGYSTGQDGSDSSYIDNTYNENYYNENNDGYNENYDEQL